MHFTVSTLRGVSEKLHKEFCLKTSLKIIFIFTSFSQKIEHILGSSQVVSNKLPTAIQQIFTNIVKTLK